MPTDDNAQPPLQELFTPRQWALLTKKLRLSPRQAEIARLICLGFPNNRIPSLLQLHDSTVRIHRRALYRKLGIRDRVGVPVTLILAAKRRKLGHKADHLPRLGEL
ncbi:MAG: LuxR C-terminal-related transcriptional regulator [Planctomycetota bacterium]